MPGGSSVKDTLNQQVGRALIAVSGSLLVAVVSQMGQRAGRPLDNEAWWKEVLAATFNPHAAGPIVWALLALFGVGNVLNLIGLWPELRRLRFSIAQLMAAVGVAALFFFLLGFSPPASLVLILMAALSPAWLVGTMRRREALRQDRVRS